MCIDGCRCRQRVIGDSRCRFRWTVGGGIGAPGSGGTRSRQLLSRLQFRLGGPRDGACMPAWCAARAERRTGNGRVGEGCLRLNDPLRFSLGIARPRALCGACNTPSIASGSTQVLTRPVPGKFLPFPLPLSTGVKPFHTPPSSDTLDCKSGIIFTSKGQPVGVYPFQQPIDCHEVRLFQDHCVYFSFSGPYGVRIFGEGRGKHGGEVFGPSCENIRVSVNYSFSCEGLRREKGGLGAGRGISGWRACWILVRKWVASHGWVGPFQADELDIPRVCTFC